MTICPIALVVGCVKCPTSSFCRFITVLGDQEEKDEFNPFNNVWKKIPPTVDEHLDKLKIEKL